MNFRTEDSYLRYGEVKEVGIANRTSNLERAY